MSKRANFGGRSKYYPAATKTVRLPRHWLKPGATGSEHEALRQRLGVGRDGCAFSGYGSCRFRITKTHLSPGFVANSLGCLSPSLTQQSFRFAPSQA
jgi:hypothetical protein